MSRALISTDGTELDLSVEGDGPPVVLVDPILVDRELSANASLAAVLRHSAQVIRYDRRGKGGSVAAAGPTPDTEVADLRAVIDATCPGRPPIVVGLSSGGSLALVAASRGVPMRALVVVEPPANLSDVDQVVARTEAAVHDGRPAEAVRELFAYQGMPDEVVSSMGELVVRLAVNAWTIPVDLHLAERVTRQLLARVTVDVLAVASAGSPPQLVEFSRFAAEHITSGRLRVLDGDWHGVPDDVLAEEIVALLSLGDG